MPTIIDTLTQLGQDLRDAIASVVGLEGRVQQKFDANTTNVTTIINNFYARPLNIDYHVDPVGGSDANDGLTFVKAKKTLDAVIAIIGTQGVQIFFYGDLTLSNRYGVSANVYLYGVQRANNAFGRTPFRRKLSFLGTAINSPSDTLGNMSSGLIFSAGSFFTDNIDVALPDVPAGITLRPHIMSGLTTQVLMTSPSITVGSSAASALFGSFNSGRIVATINPVLGSGAAGHVFDGVAAGADPNASWYYSTNLKAA